VNPGVNPLLHSERVSRQAREIPAWPWCWQGCRQRLGVPLPSSSPRLPWLQPRARPPPPVREFREPGKEGGSRRARLALPSSSLPPSPAQSTFNDPTPGVQRIRRGGSGKGRRRWGEREELRTTLFGSERSRFVPPAPGSSKGVCVAGTPPMQPRSPRRRPGPLRAHMPSPSCSVRHGESLFSMKFVAGSRFAFPAAHSASQPAAGSAQRLQGRAQLLLARMGWGC